MWIHLITVIFIIAKLHNLIDWSWFLVLLPSIIAAAIGLLIIGITAIAMLIAAKHGRLHVGRKG